MLLMGLAALAVLATSGLALWQRPWRAQAGGLPWPWLALWLLLPLLWSPDRWSGVAMWPPASGAVLSVLLAGWPLTVLALAVSALATVADGALSWSEALQRWFWLGTLPATLTAVAGALLMSWRLARVRRHDAQAQAENVGLFLLGRGFVGTLAAAALAAAGTAQGAAAGLLLGFAEAALTTMLLALLLACRPRWVRGWRDAA